MCDTPETTNSVRNTKLSAGPRARSWIFTLNTYSEDDIIWLTSTNCKCIKFQSEVAPSTGTKHLQGYVSFANAKSMAQVKKWMNNAKVHLEVVRKEIAAKKYCEKSESYDGNIRFERDNYKIILDERCAFEEKEEWLIPGSKEWRKRNSEEFEKWIRQKIENGNLWD